MSPLKKERIPDGIRIYAIGDVHGRADLLQQVLSRIDDHLNAYPVSRAIHVFLGDYVDRGPASQEVLDRLIERTQSHELICLKGNHESYLLNFLNDPNVLDEWRHFGGLQTLLSYGLAPSFKNDAATRAELSAALNRAIPHTHRQFLSDLRLSFTCGDFFFVHAGVRPGIPLPRQREEDLLGIREKFLNSKEKFDKLIIHGHTPVLKPEICFNRINIDTGAFATGRLTCLILEGDELMFI
jgi:serine/threonine protein phosphatase 1